MVVCKYYLRGTCKFGNQCRFDHPPLNSSSSSSSSSQDERIKTILDDVTSNRPPWPFSSYGFPDEPSLFHDMEVSQEELRCLFKYQPEVYRTECQRLFKLAHQTWSQIQTHPSLHASSSTSMSTSTTTTSSSTSSSSFQSFLNPTPMTHSSLSTPPSLTTPPSFNNTSTSFSLPIASTPFTSTTFPSFSTTQPPTTSLSSTSVSSQSPSFAFQSQPPPPSSTTVASFPFSSTTPSPPSTNTTETLPSLSSHSQTDPTLLHFQANEFQMGQIPVTEPPVQFR